MKAVIQRVDSAKLSVENQEISRIGKGILTLLGIEKGDQKSQLEKLIQKIINLRIFEDSDGKMNLSLQNIRGEHMIVSQFTLMANCDKGKRPSFDAAEAPKQALLLYNESVTLSSQLGVKSVGGVFGAHMKIDFVNDGPATFILNE